MKTLHVFWSSSSPDTSMVIISHASGLREFTFQRVQEFPRRDVKDINDSIDGTAG